MSIHGLIAQTHLSLASITIQGELEQALRALMVYGAGLVVMRLNGRLDDVAHVRRACLERNGEISVMPHGSEPKVVDIAVEQGVQTVRIELR